MNDLLTSAQTIVTFYCGMKPEFGAHDCGRVVCNLHNPKALDMLKWIAKFSLVLLNPKVVQWSVVRTNKA